MPKLYDDFDKINYFENLVRNLNLSYDYLFKIFYDKSDLFLPLRKYLDFIEGKKFGILDNLFTSNISNFDKIIINYSQIISKNCGEGLFEKSLEDILMDSSLLEKIILTFYEISHDCENH